MAFDKSVLERYRWLCQQVDTYDDLYQKGKSPISDEMFDALVAELEELEAAHPSLKYAEEQGLPATWSLERTFQENAVGEFDKWVRVKLQQVGPIEYVVEPKIDGCSLCLIYRGGRLVNVRTRGLEGESQDVTARILRSPAVCSQLLDTSERAPRYLELKGEATITRATFRAINRKRRCRGWNVLGTTLACVNQILAVTEGPLLFEGAPPLEIHCHEVLAADIPLPETCDELVAKLEAWGLMPIPSRRICTGIGEVLTYYAELLEVQDRFEYEMDGVVLKVNYLPWHQRLGQKTLRRGGREKQIPLWALAYKFPYRGELGTVARLVPTTAQERSVPFELEVCLEGTSQPVRATLDSKAAPPWLDVYVGDTVRIRRPLGKVAEVVSLEERSGSRQDLEGVAFALVNELPTIGKNLAIEVARARGANVMLEINQHTDFVVVGKALPPGVLDKAREMDAQIITEREFLSMLSLEMPVDGMSAHQLQLL